MRVATSFACGAILLLLSVAGPTAAAEATGDPPAKPAGDAVAQESVVDWVRRNAIPLSTTEAGHGFKDLKPLKAIVGDARVVALGEATHGTREFFQLKHRLLEFLATKMGFTIFSIEANMPEAYRLNDYVLHGRGDPATLLKGMYFWTWDTEEVLDMIRWMREFNASGKGRLQFTGFDMQTPDVAAGIVVDFVKQRDPAFAPEVREASDAAITSTAQSRGGSFGVATWKFPVEEARGKTVRYTGYIRTEGVEHGWAGLWWRVDGESRILAFDNLQGRGPTGSTDWLQYAIDLPVDEKATNIVFGVLMSGHGEAWFDDLAIELDGRPYTDASRFDFGFESPFVSGFNTGGKGYVVALDPAVSHDGLQSLHMASALPSTANPPEAAAAAARWKEIVAHLEANRSAYRAAGAAEHDIAWAAQNARIVLQAAQLRSGEVPRDRSMAENVEWILDQNPVAKVVLWAHNGHVSSEAGEHEPMGSVLRKVLGRRMVVFGFAFNEGSFQSMELGKGALATFTVPPGHPDGLDATLAASGLLLFALDLRQSPEWFAQEHASRQIGALYSPDHADDYVADIAAAKRFDALLFVEKTFAARPNR
jgi:erythromycin esterase-like protein